MGYPATESGLDIQLLKHLFTQEEARIASYLSSIQLESAARNYKRISKSGMRLSLEELERVLDHMVQKGLVLAYREGHR